MVQGSGSQIVCLKGKREGGREREKYKGGRRERERMQASVHWFNPSTPKILKTARVGPHTLGLPHRWQELKFLSHYLLSLRVSISRKLELELQLGLTFKYSSMGRKYSK